MAPFATAETGVMQERTSLPSTSAEHAPHWASPQPNFGPFSSRSLRRTYSRGVSGSTATVRVPPLTRSVKVAMASSVAGRATYIMSARREGSS